METKEIPRNEWPKFFNFFSRQHEGWLATLEILGSEIGAQVEERGMAFEGIVDEANEVQGHKILIMFGARPDDHVTHSISNPTTVTVEQTDEGTYAVMAIKTADGVTALLRFRSVAVPELVDAVAG